MTITILNGSPQKNIRCPDATPHEAGGVEGVHADSTAMRHVLLAPSRGEAPWGFRGKCHATPQENHQIFVEFSINFWELIQISEIFFGILRTCLPFLTKEKNLGHVDFT